MTERISTDELEVRMAKVGLGWVIAGVALLASLGAPFVVYGKLAEKLTALDREVMILRTTSAQKSDLQSLQKVLEIQIESMRNKNEP